MLVLQVTSSWPRLTFLVNHTWQTCRSSALQLAAIFLTMSPVHAETYYVDFDSGNDSNTGLSPTAAWKRSPGDPEASGLAGSKELMGGDIVQFKGGVSYRGTIKIGVSGSKDNPISFRGDGWGVERARLDGADPWVANWTACPSAEAAAGNSEFAQIYFTQAPSNYATFFTGLYEDGEFLWYSQGPDVTEPFYYDNNYQYYPIEIGSSAIKQTRSSITDATRLIQDDANFWNGAHVATWVQGNLVAIKAIDSFDPASHTVFHSELESNVYTDRTSYYSMLNHVSLISRPGEYAYDPANGRLYVWPSNSDGADQHEYSVQARETAFTLASASYINIVGFSIQHYAQAIHADSTSATGIIVRNNEISKLRSGNKYAIFVNAANSLVEGNRVVDCQRAVGILSSASGITIRNNFVSRTSRQGIWLMGAKRCQILNNTITDILGSHANAALSIYSGSSDILVANNAISIANSPITFEESSNLTFFGNVVDGGNRNHAAADWYGTSGRILFINNTFVRHPGSPCILELKPEKAEYVILNNILDGGGPDSSVHDYNLYIGSPQWTLSPNEEVRSRVSDIFVAPDATDWRPKPDGPAVDTAKDPYAYLPHSDFPDFNFNIDRNGIPRGLNNGWDRGAYEYSPVHK